MLEAGICSTQRIAHFWGLTGTGAVERGSPRADAEVVAKAGPRLSKSSKAAPISNVGNVIEDALRAAGLMR
jgi:hypothetical protein